MIDYILKPRTSTYKNNQINYKRLKYVQEAVAAHVKRLMNPVVVPNMAGPYQLWSAHACVSLCVRATTIRQ